MTDRFFPAMIVPKRAKDAVQTTRAAPLGTVRDLRRSAPRGASLGDIDNRAAGPMASCAHSTGRQTKCRAAEAVAGRRGIPGNASNLSGAGFYASCEALYPRPSCILVRSQIYPACLDNQRP